MTSHLTTIGIL